MTATATVSPSASLVIPSPTPSPSDTPISDIALLQALPAGGSDLLALADPGSGGLIGIEVTASGLPRMLDGPDFTVSLVAGASEVLAPPCARTGDFTLQCLVPPGASADLEVRVAYRGGSSRPPLVSFAGPVLDSVYIDNSTAGATGYLLVLQGRNLGSLLPLVSGNLTLERVELLADPRFDDTTLLPGQRAPRCAYAPCGPAPVRALACAYAQPQTRVECALDPSSFGERLSVRAWVGGQPSAWSAQTVDYPAPRIASIALVNQSKTMPGLVGQQVRAGSGIACDGTSFVRIVGAGFVKGGADITRLVIGGTVISNSKLVFSNSDPGLPASAITLARNVTGPSVSSIEARVPPGFGLVKVTLRVGNRTASSQLEYEAPTITSEVKGDRGVIAYNRGPRSITISGTGLAPCAFCFDNRAAASDCSGIVFNVPDDGCAVPEGASSFRAVQMSLNATNSRIDGSAEWVIVSDTSALSVLPGWKLDGSQVMLKIEDQVPSPPWALVKGTLTLSFAGASKAVVWAPGADPSQGYDFQRDLATLPYGVAFQDPKPWTSAPVTLKLNYAGGNAGSIRIAQYSGNSSVFESAPFVFECPTVWNTTVTTNPAVDTPAATAITVQAYLSAFSNSDTAQADLSAAGGLDVSATSCAKNCTGVNLTGVIRPLTQAHRECLACVVPALGAERRLAWNKNSLSWQLRAIDATCYIISWEGRAGVVNKNANGKEDTIVFAPPPWQGTGIFVKVVADGNEQKEPYVGTSYAPPSILPVGGITPPFGPTRRSPVTVRGSSFGPFQTVRRAFDALRASGCVYNDQPWPASWGSHEDTNKVYFQYTGSTSPRYCNVTSWTAGAINCSAPVGVPSSVNDVVVQVVDPLAAFDSSAQNNTEGALQHSFTYNQPSISSFNRTDHGEIRTVGGYELEVLGRDLSAFPVQGAKTDPSFADNDGQWFVSATLSAVLGAGFVQAGLEVGNITAHDHERIAFLLADGGAFAIFEGTVTATITFKNTFDTSTKPVTIPLPLIAAPPMVDLVEAVPDPDLRDLSTDPCLALNTTTFLACENRYPARLSTISRTHPNLLPFPNRCTPYSNPEPAPSRSADALGRGIDFAPSPPSTRGAARAAGLRCKCHHGHAECQRDSAECELDAAFGRQRDRERKPLCVFHGVAEC